MGYFQVRYDSRVVNYDRRVFIRLATDVRIGTACQLLDGLKVGSHNTENLLRPATDGCVSAGR